MLLDQEHVSVSQQGSEPLDRHEPALECTVGKFTELQAGDREAPPTVTLTRFGRDLHPIDPRQVLRWPGAAAGGQCGDRKRSQVSCAMEHVRLPQ